MKNGLKLVWSMGFLAAVIATVCAEERPNFIIIFTDDQGYQDVGCFGSPDIKTPRIDQMAKEGMKFASFYALTFGAQRRTFSSEPSYGFAPKKKKKVLKNKKKK